QKSPHPSASDPAPHRELQRKQIVRRLDHIRRGATPEAGVRRRLRNPPITKLGAVGPYSLNGPDSYYDVTFRGREWGKHPTLGLIKEFSFSGVNPVLSVGRTTFLINPLLQAQSMQLAYPD